MVVLGLDDHRCPIWGENHWCPSRIAQEIVATQHEAIRHLEVYIDWARPRPTASVNNHNGSKRYGGRQGDGPRSACGPSSGLDCFDGLFNLAHGEMNWEVSGGKTEILEILLKTFFEQRSPQPGRRDPCRRIRV